MAVCFVCWSVVVVLCMTKVAEQTIELTSQSLGSPDYYINDTLKLNCITSGYTGIAAQRFAVGGEKDAGCTLSADGWGPFASGILTLPSTDYCEVNGDRTGFTLLASLTITPDVAGYQIRCQHEVDLVAEFSNTLPINTSLKVAPQGLAFVRYNQEQPVVEGEAFGFKCMTTSTSDSAYRYDLKRNGNVVRNLTETPYTPNEEDRDGFSILCVDITHVNWRGGNTQTESEIIYPLYITVEGDEGIQRNVSLNPVRPLRLTCDVTGNPSPAFSWERKSNPLMDTSKSITLEGGSVNNGDNETVTCTATVEGIPSITITWTVTWDNNAQTSPSPPAATPATGSSVNIPLVVAVPVGILLLVIIVIAVFCLKKRKDSRGPSSNERGSSGALKHKIYTNETDKPRSAPPRNSRKLKKNNADDEPPFRDYKDEPIIYTEVDLNHKPVIRDSERVKSRRAPPPPMGEPVEYASIDLNRTAAYSKKNQNGGDEYENLGQHSDIPAVRAPSRPMRRQEH